MAPAFDKMKFDIPGLIENACLKQIASSLMLFYPIPKSDPGGVLDSKLIFIKVVRCLRGLHKVQVWKEKPVFQILPGIKNGQTLHCEV